ncbi:SpoVA/SpoVAEb family sporulation membrane protein [Tannockella kyphosi]|uniref:SpoVA/SpoVAEb family sporulation membrane protein n=1 Tax=Tannockella kyphosi TaxID=2899121 RepID=UPI0020130D85|nr:SpoVA/SpoVAEb family sporulation membrane protein [Tannockella kyphosi]
MNYLLAFVFCGFVCLVAQVIYDHSNLTPGHIICYFVIVGAVLDFFNIYDTLVSIFHAGALLPITSFGHSLMHGAMEATDEFGIFGLALGMFDLTAAGITSAIVFAFLVALFSRPKS